LAKTFRCRLCNPTVGRSRKEEQVENKNISESPNQQINHYAIAKALALLRSLQPLERADQDGAEHLLGMGLESRRERGRSPTPRRASTFATNRKAHIAGGVENQMDVEVVPLQSAVLCVDCESVSNSRFDECPVCGSHSLFNIARMLGGTLLPDKANCSEKEENTGRFDLEITIDLKQIGPKDINAAVEGISSLIGPRLGRGRASFHINVEPIVDCSTASATKAA
jgi:hypothetical protein